MSDVGARGTISDLFEPASLGKLRVPNRFVRSATYEAMADHDGGVTPRLVKLYRTLGKSRIGTIISSLSYVSPEGKGPPSAIGIERDERVEGLAELASAAKANGSAFFVQLAHSGAQASKRITGYQTVAPSSHLRDPMYFERPVALDSKQIAAIIDAFGSAAERAVRAGADGVQLHGAHGYLIAEFLSPFFNQRTDEWGGSPANRFRLLKEIVLAVRERAGSKLPLLVKIVHDDATPKPGMTPELAADAAARLAELGIAALELSAGGSCWAPFRMCRGDVPVEELARVYPWLLRPIARRRFRAMREGAAFEPNCNASAAKQVKEALGSVPLMLVGTIRDLDAMHALRAGGHTDFISLSRPFIRQPTLVRRFEQGRSRAAACESCNLCFAAICHDLPLRCYTRGLPRP